MEKMRFKVGDRVRIKSLDWYNANKSKSHGTVACGGKYFDYDMREWCGKTMTIFEVYQTCYLMEEDVLKHLWTDEMIEGLVEGEIKFGTASNPIEIKSNANCITQERVDALATKIDKELPSGCQNVLELLDGYQFVDENGNVINAQKIFLEKKKKEYPKTYEECCKVLDFCGDFFLTTYDAGGMVKKEVHGILQQVNSFTRLLICKSAFWKIAGEEMGLGKPWEPDWKNDEQFKYVIICRRNCVIKDTFTAKDVILAFPTAEMQDAFYENFKELINECKELL